jgi:hypothetical protein
MTDTEVITPDAVVHSDQTPGTDVAVPDQADPGASAAIERAANAALAMPGVPGRDEFLALAMQARMLAMSGAAPEAVRNDPYVAFHVAMVGRDLGISPSAALQLIDVIKTRNGYQLSLSPQLLNGQIRRLGLGRVEPVIQERDRCIARAVGPDGTVLGETEFTWEDARDAQLVGPKCMPGEHVIVKDGKCGCNQGYRTYPRRMMWWRASGFCANDYFPDAGLGLYSPEELGAVVDEQGRPLDPATVALPAGYDDPVEQRRQQQAEADRPADPVKLWELQELIHALPQAVRDELREGWKDEQSRVKGFAPHVLPQRLVPVARALVNARWAKARRLGVDQAVELAALRDTVGRIVAGIRWGWIDTPPADVPASAGDSTVQTPDSPAAPATPGEAPAAQDGEPGGGSAPVMDWRPLLRDTAKIVEEVVAASDPAVAARISGAVHILDWRKINKEIADAGMTEMFPPDCPIDLRRMEVTILRLAHFEDTGEVLE